MSSSIEIRALTKRYGATTAVSDLTFTVRPGTITGFLGPKGAGSFSPPAVQCSQ
jgi:ABC-2 type transport system ATP-binding protein